MEVGKSSYGICINEGLAKEGEGLKPALRFCRRYINQANISNRPCG